MCVDVWTGDVVRDLSWEFESKDTIRISIPLRKFNVAEKGAGEVRWVRPTRLLWCTDHMPCTLFSVLNLILYFSTFISSPPFLVVRNIGWEKSSSANVDKNVVRHSCDCITTCHVTACGPRGCPMAADYCAMALLVT